MRCGPFAAQHLDGLAIAQARRRRASVSATCSATLSSGNTRRGDAALRVRGVALGELGLGDDASRRGPARLEGGDQPGDAAADDDDARHRQAAIVVFGLAASIRSSATRAGRRPRPAP